MVPQNGVHHEKLRGGQGFGLGDLLRGGEVARQDAFKFHPQPGIMVPIPRNGVGKRHPLRIREARVGGQGHRGQGAALAAQGRNDRSHDRQTAAAQGGKTLNGQEFFHYS